jgi:hypothetical protein
MADLECVLEGLHESEIRCGLHPAPRLTLFPTHQNVSRPDQSNALRKDPLKARHRGQLTTHLQAPSKVRHRVLWTAHRLAPSIVRLRVLWKVRRRGL